MNVNFNNLRKQAIYSYHRLCTTLNENTDKNGFISLDATDIQRDMDNLRSQLWGICCTYREGDDSFKELTEEIDAKGEIANFNPEE